jgi:hypothetical protein
MATSIGGFTRPGTKTVTGWAAGVKKGTIRMNRKRIVEYSEGLSPEFQWGGRN